jgi:DNA-binding MarR family transcriptional regulator
MNQKEIKKLSWVKRGKQRREIIIHLKGTQTPSEIAKKSHYSLNNTSRVLNDFKRQGLLKLLNPKEKTGRLYELTNEGKIIKERLQKATSDSS